MKIRRCCVVCCLSSVVGPLSAVFPYPGIAVSTRRAQYDVPTGITSSLKS